MVPLLQEGVVDESAYHYLNRMSDYLFMLARFVAQTDKQVETIYQKAKE